MASPAIEPPEWLTQEFVQSALRTCPKYDNLTIAKFSVAPGTNVADNYASQIFRITIETGNAGKITFLVKSLPSGAMKDFVNEQKFFEKEAKVLSETLPKLHRHLLRAGITHQVFADVLYSQGPPRNLIIMEDLKATGYVNADRQLGLDLEHTLAVLEALASLHAASLSVLEEEPEAVNFYEQSFWSESNKDLLVKSLKQGVVALAKETEKWENIPKKYVQKLKDLEGTILKKTFDSYRKDEKRLNVLLHGDTWTNNFMFKYDKGAIHSVKLVDFQLSSFNSPVIDLLYLVFSSPIESIKLRCLDLFLDTYHRKLVETCGKLKIRNMHYTLQDLKRDFQERLFFGFAVTLLVFPFTIAPAANAVDVNEVLNNTKEYNTLSFQNLRFQKSLEIVLPYFEEHGVI